MFAHSIKTNRRAPVDLRSQINLPAPEDDFEKQVEKTVNVYNLRRGRILVKNIIAETKYEPLTFKHFFPRLLLAPRFFCKKRLFQTSNKSKFE